MFSIYHFLDFLVRRHASNLLPRRKLKSSASWTSIQRPSPGNESLTAVSWVSNRSIDWLGCFCALGQVRAFWGLVRNPACNAVFFSQGDKYLRKVEIGLSPSEFSKKKNEQMKRTSSYGITVSSETRT